MKEEECSTVEEARWAPIFREVHVQITQQLYIRHKLEHIWERAEVENACVKEYAVHIWPAILAAWSFGPLYYSYKELVL